MKKYFSLLKMRFIAGLQYRTAAFAGVATQFAWGYMLILMFRAFYEADSGSFPMRFEELSSYIWLQQALLALFMSWYFDMEIFESITSGGVGYDLCRPLDIYWMWYVRNIAARFAKAALRCVPILFVAVMLPKPYGISMPHDWVAACLFVVSLLLGVLVLVAFSMLIYISAFYTISSEGIRVLSVSVVEFFSGALIPLPFFPGGLQLFMKLLPFASTQNTPFLIYVGHYGRMEAIISIGIQILWFVVLTMLGRLMIKRALRRVVVQGG